jgi:hypothetical protein
MIIAKAALDHIPLSSAYLCQDCDSIGNCASYCPACASPVVMGLAGVLNRETAATGGALAVVEFMPTLLHERRTSTPSAAWHRAANRRVKNTNQKAIAS